jgi:hypothetical protein
MSSFVCNKSYLKRFYEYEFLTDLEFVFVKLEIPTPHCNTRGTFLKNHGFQNLPFLSLTHQVYPN